MRNQAIAAGMKEKNRPVYGLQSKRNVTKGSRQMRKNLYGLGIFILGMSIAGTAFALTNIETLGKMVYEDTVYSANGNQSCQTCHHPKAQFSDPVNRISPMYRPNSEGSFAGDFGGRNAPPSAYAAYSPPMEFNVLDGLFIGGLFWDGRASGTAESLTAGLGAGPTLDPLADQAKGPFGNPAEMALVDESPGGQTTEQKVVSRLQAAAYAKLYKKAFGTDIAALNLTDETAVDIAYNNIALAISAFEKSTELNRFNSKFDKFVGEQGLATVLGLTAPGTVIKSVVYTQEEIDGLALFNGKGQCSLCHILDNQPDGKTPTVFTDFSYDNLGIPTNLTLNALAGTSPPDLGLGDSSMEPILQAAYEAVNGPGSWTTGMLGLEQGKFKVSSLRNIARTAPYGHNGFFPTLYDIVHFYNTRDVPDAGWPASEVLSTVNVTELGNLGLTFEEEQKIVVFLETLTDL